MQNNLLTPRMLPRRFWLALIIPALLLVLLVTAGIAHAAELEVKTVLFAKEREAWLIESHDVPVVTVKLAFRDAGSATDPAKKQGRAQMLAALLNEGAGDMDALSYQKALESLAIKLSFGVDKDMLTAEMETLSENRAKAFELLAVALANPRLDADAIARVKGQMHAALRQEEEDPRYVAGRALEETIFGTHPYAQPTGGTHEGIDALTREDLTDYLSKHVTQQNLQMAVVGDVSADELKTLISTSLATLPVTYGGAAIAAVDIHAAGQTDTVRRSIPQSVVLFAGPGIARNDPDFYTAFVLNHLLGGGTLTSKIGDEIREKRGLAYYAYTQLQLFDHGAAFTGGFGTRNEQAADALSVLMGVMRAVQKGEISDFEMDEAKSFITGAWPLTLASNDGIASMLLTMMRFDLGKDYLQKRNGYINAVGKKDLMRVAKRLLHPHKLAITAVGDPSKNLADFR